jgi:hypothetical protein
MASKRRELVDTGTDKRYVRREADGTFSSDQVDVGRSSAADQRKHAGATSTNGDGDRGDRPRKS